MSEKIARKICVVGLGYVGLPLAVKFGKIARVSGFDIDSGRIEELRRGNDRTGEVDDSELRESDINFTTDPSVISDSDFIIAAIPTPVDDSKRPDLSLLRDAARTIGKHLKRGSMVVFESTVYPGATEEVCLPILKEESGLACPKDFKIGYSPERINPGDREHTVDRVIKIVSGCDSESLAVIADVYRSVIRAGVYSAPSIRVAESAKIIENVQRDINIALMNELKIIFDRMGIEMEEVLKAARTKWNFLDFHPGLVGGHCIGIDPYYLAYKAEISGHHPEMILAGRRINDNMAKYIAGLIINDMIKKEIRFKKARVLFLGATFKPNVKDLRNSKIEDVIRELRTHGCSVDIYEPVLGDMDRIFGCRNIKKSELMANRYDYTVLAVRHEQFKGMKKRADFSI